MIFLFGAIYFVLLVTLGMMTFRKRHFFLFWIGIIFPVLWIVGALIAPATDYEGGTA
jgi:hypothetical protein